jgi:hypothetical protein
MCCETHDLRDFITWFDGGDQALAELLAPGGDYRCRCTELGKWQGQRCERRADGEDLLCPWCRGTEHQGWYMRQLGGQSPAVLAYYAQHGEVGYAQAYPTEPSRRLPRVRRLPREPRGELAGYSADVPGNEYLAAPVPSVPELTDYRSGDASGQPLRFTPGEIEEMRAASGLVQWAETKLTFEFPPADASGVMKYLMRKYGV